MANRHTFIGDVHGMSEMLSELMSVLAPHSQDTVVFLGDLIDKGPNSAGVVRTVRTMAENSAFEVVLIEGNHEELHRRYRRNLILRPDIAAEQAERRPELEELASQLSLEDVAFLESAVPFYRVPELGILAVHGGIPGDMESFPSSVSEIENLTSNQRRSFDKILRTRFVDANSGSFIMKGHESEQDPFWAERYDGRFGHVVFGHYPFMDGPATFPFATGIDTGAVHGGALTALIVGRGNDCQFVSVDSKGFVTTG